MRLLPIGMNEGGQRADKLLSKYLPLAPKGFLYKMLRKKNITLNDKKITGSKILREGDVLKLWISDDVLDSFRYPVGSGDGFVNVYPQAGSRQTDKEPFWQQAKTAADDFVANILYEDRHLLVLNKPSGMLTQKDSAFGISLNELFLRYLSEKKEITPNTLATFRPSVCHRLDRNTSGILFFGKTLPALQQMTRLLGEGAIEKYYVCIVRGQLREKIHAKDFLKKEERHNQVRVCPACEEGAREAESLFIPLFIENGYTLIKARIFTGRSHQIRVQLAHRGYPIWGDPKYGQGARRPVKPKRRKGLNGAMEAPCFNEKEPFGQWLHSWESILPDMEKPLSHLSQRHFVATPPEMFFQKMKGYVWEHGRREDCGDPPSKI